MLLWVKLSSCARRPLRADSISLRTTSEALLGEILDAWFAAQPSPDDNDRANVGHLAEIER